MAISLLPIQAIAENASLTLPAALQTRTYTVFISSGNDVVRLRDRIHALYRVASEVLSFREIGIRLEVSRWEMAVPHRAPTSHVNDEFVRRALESHLVIALLLHEIRPGTLEELEAVLQHEVTNGPEVAVFCFESSQPRSEALNAFLSTHREKLLFKEVGPPDTDEAWYELTRVVLDFVIRVISIQEPQEPYFDKF